MRVPNSLIPRRDRPGQHGAADEAAIGAPGEPAAQAGGVGASAGKPPRSAPGGAAAWEGSTGDSGEEGAAPVSWEASARMLRARRRQLRTAVVMLCLLVAGVTLGLAAYERAEFRHTAMTQAELYARVIESHASRTLTGVSGTLRLMSQSPLLRVAEPDMRAVAQVLGDQLSAQASLRSLAVLDGSGRVLVSSTPTDVGRRIDPARLLRRGMANPPREWLGPLLQVRDLGDLAMTHVPTLGAVALPLVRRVTREDGQELWLVALLNGDYFATQHDLAVADTPMRPLVTDLQGQLISTGAAELRPGQSVSQLPPFKLYLPQREHGSYIADGSDGATAVGAFRTSRQWPLVVLVEQPYAQLRQGWLERTMLFGAVATSMCLLLAVLGMVADRGMRRERQTQRQLLAAHDEIARNQERFRATFEQAAVGMLERSTDGRLLRVNSALCSLLGYTEAEMLALDPEALVHPDDCASSLLNVRRLFAGELSSLTQEKRYRRKDGRYVWVRLNASIARAADGRPAFMLGIVEDVSARRLALKELERARQRELRIGARIQQTLLVQPPDQRVPGLWLSTFNQASQGIDGDFVEFLPLGDRGIDIVVGDVMGKGVSAALIGAATKMQISRCLAELMASPDHRDELPTPAQIVGAVSRALTPNLQQLEAFVTLCHLRIDSRAGKLTWVGCGHEEPMLLTAKGSIKVLANQHPPLGVLDEDSFQQDTMDIASDEALFMCSDGAVDALLPDGSRMGREQITALVTELLQYIHTPAALLHKLRQRLQELGAIFKDDLTMALAMRTLGDPLRSRRELPARLEAIYDVRGLVEYRARQAGLADDEVALFVVACVEAFTNVVRHGRGRPGDSPIELLVSITDEALVVELVHLGEAFDAPVPTALAEFDDYPEGGFGMFIMHSATDKVEHLHDRGINTVRLTHRRALSHV
ncbi:SpoIIE family protein phosphatase [Azohydromonas lata]|uniref:SpoIIE family protein phosphatase n=1 Tax=Azohydromonas lata TaxID=45677 RepID=A0ABU5IQ20_9BURK|nr:SpoIIE family protein phosphatase [Azohydromonas lata]MDZ5460980.1 SpoIIE family protein phosphatase [Azohydromonas lata]